MSFLGLLIIIEEWVLVVGGIICSKFQLIDISVSETIFYVVLPAWPRELKLSEIQSFMLFFVEKGNEGIEK